MFYETFIIVYDDGSYAANAGEPTTTDKANVAQFDSLAGATEDAKENGGTVRIGRWESADGIKNPDTLVAYRDVDVKQRPNWTRV